MSLDAFFWSGVRASVDRETWRRLTSDVTILMYHAFCIDGESPSVYVLPRHIFAGQMMLLRLLRRQVVPLQAYVAMRRSHALPPPRSVVITIDDGYQDVYEIAAPILSRHRYPATVFAVTGRVGQRADWPPEGPLRDRPLAGWPRLRLGVADGIEVGAHTRTHPRLSECSDEQVADEIAGSLADLELGLREPVLSFAYPGGDEDARARRLVTQAGFVAACTSRMGKNGPCEPLERLRRIEVRGDHGLGRFLLALMLGRPALRGSRQSPELT